MTASTTNNNRVYIIKEGEKGDGPVVYWMSREQRTLDNWALIYSQELALKKREPLCAVFCLAPRFLHAALRQYLFMIEGLKEVEKKLKNKNIPFFLLLGDPAQELNRFIIQNNASIIVTDFDPLKIKLEWKNNIKKRISIPFHEIDARNIVPCRLASNKKEYAAYTIRPKIKRLLPVYLHEYPELLKHPYAWRERGEAIDWDRASITLKTDRSVTQVQWILPGEDAAHTTLKFFLDQKIHNYPIERNDPSKDALSNLSPYLHFGQISAQRIALETNKLEGNRESKEAFLEELIVRRELADNFCYYNENYDTPDCFPRWAKETLHKHRKDAKQYTYTTEQLEYAQTHDHLWNASQIEMVNRGKMHGYMRMYWAKKILEWTDTVDRAMKIAIYLNDKYELDGRESNGYAGIAWALGGVHDRPWFERPVFGKVRYMSYNGCKSKFNIEAYIDKVKKT